MSDSHERVSGSGVMLISTVVAVAVGVLILLGLVPTFSDGAAQPVCSAAFGNVVSCGGQGPAMGLACAGGLVSGLLARFVVRRTGRG